MAKLRVSLTVKIAWWVQPYLRGAALAWAATCLFVDLDEEDREAFIERQSAFVTAHGVTFLANGKRI